MPSSQETPPGPEQVIRVKKEVVRVKKEPAFETFTNVTPKVVISQLTFYHLRSGVVRRCFCLTFFFFTSRKAGQHVLLFQVMTFVYLMGRGRFAFLKILGLLIPGESSYLATTHTLPNCLWETYKSFILYNKD